MWCLRKPPETNGLATRTFFGKMGEADLKICRRKERSHSGVPRSGYLSMLFSRQLYKSSSHPYFRFRKEGSPSPCVMQPGAPFQPFALASFQALGASSSLCWFLWSPVQGTKLPSGITRVTKASSADSGWHLVCQNPETYIAKTSMKHLCRTNPRFISFRDPY